MQTDEEEDGILINGAQGHQPDPDEEFGTPPTRGASETRHTWLEALVAEERSSRLRYRRNATVPARAVRTGARQMSMGRMRAEMDRTRTLDRAAARAYKVQDPTLLDVLGIQECTREGAAGTGLATGLSTLASSVVPLHESSSQADIVRAGTPPFQMSAGSRHGSAVRLRPNRRTPAGIPSPSSGRSSPALSLAAHSQHTLSAARAATRPADNVALPARPASQAPVPGAWGAAARSAAPVCPPFAPPTPAPLRQRGQAWSSTGAEAGPSRSAALEPVAQEPPAMFGLPLERPGLGMTVSLGLVNRRISALSVSVQTAGLETMPTDQLESARCVWAESIHDALSRSRSGDSYSSLEGAQMALEDAQEQADDLKTHLIMLCTTKDSWTELETQIKALEEARSAASSIMQKLNIHREYLSQADVSEVQSTYSDDLVALAIVISDAVSEQLGKVASTLSAEGDVRAPLRVSLRAIRACASVAGELRASVVGAGTSTPPPVLQAETGGDVCAPLERAAVRIVEASLRACNELAHDVLQPSSLTPPVGHALSQRERSLRAMWRVATELVTKCVKHWKRQALYLYEFFGDVYSEAARLALTMIADTMSSRLGHLHLQLLGSDTDHSFNSVLSVLRQLDKYCAPKDSTGNNISNSMVSSSVAPESVNSAASGLGWSAVVASGGGAAPQQQSGGMGANQSPWGTTAGKALPTGTVVSDEELLAHSWVPRLLMELHGRACGVHKRLKDLLASVAGSALLGAPSLTPTGMAHRRSANGGSGSLGGQLRASGALLASPDVQRTYDLMDEMQERFASLVLNNFQRTAWLCNAEVVPYMWALEVLKDQAENALRLGTAYDSGTLGIGDMLQDAKNGLEEWARIDAALGMDGEEPEERAALRAEYEDRLHGLSTLLGLLQSSSQEVVRVFLHLRRQLKIRRPNRHQSDMGLPARLPAGARPSRQAGQPALQAAGHNGMPGDTQARQAVLPAQQADGRGVGTQPHSAPETARGTPRSGGGQITSPFAALTNNTDSPAISLAPIPASTSHRQPAAQPVSNGTASQHGSPADRSTPRSQAAATRHPSCEQPAVAGTYTAAAVAAPALGTEQQPITLLQPVSSWRAVVAATTLSGQHLLNAAANRANPTFTFPSRPLPTSPGNAAGSLFSAGLSAGRAGEGQALMALRARPPLAPTSTQTGTQQAANRPYSPFEHARLDSTSANVPSRPGSRVSPALSQVSNAAQVTSATVVATRPSQQQQQTAGRGARGQSARQPAGSAAQSAVAQASHAPAPLPQPDDAFWHIPYSDLQNALIEPLGGGSFGMVWLGRYLHSEVAIKIIKVDSERQTNEEAFERFNQEVYFQRQLSRHPNIVRFIGSSYEHTPSDDKLMLAIVMERAMLGSLSRMRENAYKVARLWRAEPSDARTMEVSTVLQHKLRQADPNALAFWKSWETRFQVASGAAAGIHFMHRHNVVHRDLTSNNVVLDRSVVGSQGTHKWIAKVCDFNLSRILPSNQENITYTGRLYSSLWAAPELLTGNDFNEAADVFSFGIILWEILTLEIPYATRSTSNPDQEIGRFTMDILAHKLMMDVPQGLRPTLPATHKELNGPPLLCDPAAAEQLYQDIKALIQRCWSAVPSERPGMGEVAHVLSGVLTTIERDFEQAQAIRWAATAAPAAPAAAPVPAVRA